MPQIEELQLAIASLPQIEYAQIRQWFLDRDWENWDRQIERDSAAGKLDFLVSEAAEAKKTNALRNLCCTEPPQSFGDNSGTCPSIFSTWRLLTYRGSRLTD